MSGESLATQGVSHNNHHANAIAFIDDNDFLQISSVQVGTPVRTFPK